MNEQSSTKGYSIMHWKGSERLLTNSLARLMASSSAFRLCIEGVSERDCELVLLRREASWVMLVLMTSLSWQGLRRSLEAEYTFILLIKFNALFYQSF